MRHNSTARTNEDFVEDDVCQEIHGEFLVVKWLADGSPDLATAAAKLRAQADDLDRLHREGYVFYDLVDNGHAIYCKPGDRCKECGEVFEAPDAARLASEAKEYERQVALQAAAPPQ